MAHGTVQELGEEKPLTFKVERVKKTRTLDQNNFMWKLIEEFAKFINGERYSQQDKEDIYLQQLIKHIPCRESMCLKEDLKDHLMENNIRYHIEKGIVKDKDNREWLYLYEWVGTSKFDTTKMAKLINGILDNMEIAGIDTQQFIQLTRQWREFEKAAKKWTKDLV